VQLNCSLGELDWLSLTLLSLGFAACELRKALIYKAVCWAGKTPKAGVAGSIPAGRTNPDKGFSGFPASSFPPGTVKIQLAGGRLQVDDL